jgi:hypothetical protein
MSPLCIFNHSSAGTGGSYFKGRASKQVVNRLCFGVDGVMFSFICRDLALIPHIAPPTQAMHFLGLTVNPRWYKHQAVG